MSLRLAPVLREDLRPLFRLRVADGQQGLVAPNEISLAQLSFETGAYGFCLRDGATLVGYMQVIDLREHLYREPGEPADAMYLWRLMIGADHQGKGHGAAALQALFALTRARGLARVVTSAVDRAGSALRFYERHGFRRTGAMEDDEVVLAIDL